MKSMLSIGMFDGVHPGHRHLLRQLVADAKRRGLASAVVTFDRHPLSLIRPDSCPRLLTTASERRKLLSAEGVDNVFVLPFDESTRRLTARQFMEVAVKPLVDVKAIMLGYDNGFGSDRLRDPEAYRAVFEPLGIEILRSTKSAVDENGVAPSSSAIRNALASGDIPLASRLLGRDYSVSGTVVRGRQLGRTLGFPTANLQIAPEKLLPALGVYAARAIIDGDSRTQPVPALVNIGTAPTVNGADAEKIIVEAYLDLGADSDCPDLYGRIVTTEFVGRLRGEQRFPGLEELKSAIASDLSALRQMSL